MLIGAILIASLATAPASRATNTSSPTTTSTSTSETTTTLASNTTSTTSSESSSSSPEAGVVAVVPVGSVPQEPLFNPQDGDFYVSNYNNASMSVISAMNSTAPEGPAIYSAFVTVRTYDYPTPAVLDPANGDDYVGSYYQPSVGFNPPPANSAPGVVTVMSVAGPALTGLEPDVMGSIPLGPAIPGTPVYDSADRNMYVPDGNQTFVVSDNAVIRTVDYKMYGAVFDSSDNDFYFPSGGNTISVVSGVNDTLVANLTVGTGPGEPAVAPNGNVYVPDFGNDSISIISGATNSLLTTIGVKCVPLTPAFDPTTGDAYVSCGSLGDSIIVISPNDQIVANVTLTVGEGLGMPVFDPTDGDLYVPASGVSVSTSGVQPLLGNGGAVWAISAKTNSAVGVAGVGYGPLTPAIDPQSGYLFVASANQSLTVLNPSEFDTHFVIGPGLHIPIFTSSDSNISPSPGDGLLLTMSVNATSFPSGQGISIGVDERNDLPVGNELAAANDWAEPGVLNESGIYSFFGVCGSFGLPYQGAIAEGNYAIGNLTEASWLQLSSPGVHCPLESKALDYVFQPSSDLAIVDRGTPEPMPRVFSFSGTESHTGFTYFSPGVYTVIAGDEWGALTILHFAVEAPDQPFLDEITLQNFSLCPSNCGYPSPSLTGEVNLRGPLVVENLELIVNGTDEGGQGYRIGQTNIVYDYRGTFLSPQVVVGDSYVITLVATYSDNSTASATTTVIAG
jgi:hypothetical protein